MTETILVDTSVAVPLVFAGHIAHESTVDSLGGFGLGLSGHAAFETFSVLTRLPAPARRSAATVARLMKADFPHTKFLAARSAQRLLDQLLSLGIAGGSVYDALVGACAGEHGLQLVTRDQRAADVYRTLSVDFRMLD